VGIFQGADMQEIYVVVDEDGLVASAHLSLSMAEAFIDETRLSHFKFNEWLKKKNDTMNAWSEQNRRPAGGLYKEWSRKRLDFEQQWIAQHPQPLEPQFKYDLLVQKTTLKT
jgi:hypothetical protein